MKGIVFYKMTGSGNDFVLLDGRTTTLADWPAARIVDVCDRRLGVGADGLVILTPRTPVPSGWISSTATVPELPCVAMPRSAAPGSPPTWRWHPPRGCGW